MLGWVRGRLVDPAELRRLFQRSHIARTINQHGYSSIQRYCIYAERGLAKQRVAVWITEGRLQIEYRQRLLAQYACLYDDHQGALQAVGQPMLYQTEFASPQLELFTLDEAQWRKVFQRPAQLRRKRLRWTGEQLPLPGIDRVAVLWLLWVGELTGWYFFPQV